jgi:carbon storage regulator
MLVLSRKIGEQVIIGDGVRLSIRVRVIAIQGNRVRLGFVAPDDVSICREEICFDVEPDIISEAVPAPKG